MRTNLERWGDEDSFSFWRDVFHLSLLISSDPPQRLAVTFQNATVNWHTFEKNAYVKAGVTWVYMKWWEEVGAGGCVAWAGWRYKGAKLTEVCLNQRWFKTLHLACGLVDIFCGFPALMARLSLAGVGLLLLMALALVSISLKLLLHLPSPTRTNLQCVKWEYWSRRMMHGSSSVFKNHNHK